MSAEIISMEDHRPHFSVHDPVDNKQHVVPVSLVVAIIDGTTEPFECDASMMRALLRHLLVVIADE